MLVAAGMGGEAEASVTGVGTGPGIGAGMGPAMAEGTEIIARTAKSNPDAPELVKRMMRVVWLE
jgi:hypothetical protein